MPEPKRAVLDLLLALAVVADDRHPMHRGHSRKVADYAVRLSAKLGLPPEEVETIRTAALLHDIGFIVLPEPLIVKGLSSSDEWDQAGLKAHPIIGSDLLHRLPWLREVARLVRHHHERLDGSGYPDGLKGDSVPQGAKILSLVEFFVHELSISADHNRALRQVAAEADKWFERPMVIAFAEVLKDRIGQQPEAFRLEAREKLALLAENLVKTGAKLPVLGALLKMVRQLVESRQSLEQIVRTVEADPGLTLKVMAVANSPAFIGLTPSRDVRAAIVRIGLSEVISIIAGLRSREIFLIGGQGRFGQTTEEWWREALFCALSARSLAGETKTCDAQLAYYAGLLRQIGRPVLLYAYAGETTVETLGEGEYAQLLQEIDAQAWAVSRWLLGEASLDERIVRLADRLPRPFRIPLDEPEQKIISVADLFAEINRETEVPEALIVRYKDFQRVYQEAGWNLTTDRMIRTLKRISDLYQAIFHQRGALGD